MRWRPLVRLRGAVALSSCALLVSACSGAGHERGFTPAGAIAEQPSAGSQAVAAPGAETITVAPGLQVQIEWPSGLDAAHTAMVKAFGDNYAAQWRAVGSLGKDKSYLDGVEDTASQDAYTWVRGFVAGKFSARGLAKLYSLRVASVTGRGAEVDACVDESGVRVTDTTGTPVADQPAWTKPPKSTYFQVAAVRRGDDGTWRIKLYRHAAYPDERAKECVR
ncbi:hypothetical protein N5079_00885 [Planotetraspora sp. A-T 1434]|uniref:hypothetical protein n=1 Tax=Planotetraspora sp. A-T 1434 TaxID=2979219 RepID=UPI0021BE9689|nr:hypothetical protein [Planotetraspora sp. A-T 1434]MCT9928766.1 hypothetical protein [Planotetraspora sp. A-T 1434]